MQRIIYYSLSVPPHNHGNIDNNDDIMNLDNNDKLWVCGEVPGDKTRLGKGDVGADLSDDLAQDNGHESEETEVRQDVEVTIVTIMVIIWSSTGSRGWELNSSHQTTHDLQVSAIMPWSHGNKTENQETNVRNI